MKKVFNPIKEDVSIVVNGVTYVAKAGEFSEPLNDAVADTWARTHQFLTLAVVEDANLETLVDSTSETVVDVEVTETTEIPEVAEVAESTDSVKKSAKSAKSKKK